MVYYQFADSYFEQVEKTDMSHFRIDPYNTRATSL